MSWEGRGGAGHASAQARPCIQPGPPSSQKIALQLKATLENVTNLRPVGEDFRWYLKVRRKADPSWEREEHREAVGVLGLSSSRDLSIELGAFLFCCVPR